MTKQKLYLFDTTLRDGAQTQGVDFSVEEKRLIAAALDKLGIDYIEGGWPGANPTDTEFFAQKPPLKKAAFVAFGMTKRAGKSAENDPALATVLNSPADAACLVGKSWDFQVTEALGITFDENIECIADSIRAVKATAKQAMFDAEHFFDGYKANPDYALKCVKTAFEAGARWVVLCDTNGGTLPHEIETITTQVAKHIPGENLGIHAHNDTGNAVANSLAAVRAGVRQIQGTINGLGERCGNANLITLIPTLLLKPDFAEAFETGITENALKHITATSRQLDEILNRAPNRHAPYVGAAAFAHKGGLHVSGVTKNPHTYEHVPPDAVGNERILPVSDQAGRATILTKMSDWGIDIDAKDPRITRILDVVKEKEFEGFSYDGADASFELMARRILGQVPEYFKIESFRVMVERRHNAKGELVTVSEATVKANVDGQIIFSAGDGNGPVNALDSALRRDLGKYSTDLEDLHLVDFKVRILTAGTEAVTRVLIESGDGQGNRWFTVGVSPNIVDASFQALMDSITYKLFHQFNGS